MMGLCDWGKTANHPIHRRYPCGPVLAVAIQEHPGPAPKKSYSDWMNQPVRVLSSASREFDAVTRLTTTMVRAEITSA